MLDVNIRRQSTDRFVHAFRSLREADALALLADLNAFFASERLPYYAVAEPSTPERERSSHASK
jgi:hypothetical protein